MALVPDKSITKNDNGTFTVFIYTNRKRNQRTFSTRRLAEDFWLNHHLKREKAKAYGETRDNHVAIDDLIKAYRNGVAKSPRSIVRDDWIVKRWTAWMEANRVFYVDQLKKDKIKEYEQERVAAGVKQRTANIDLDFMNAVLNFALRMDKIAFNPMTRYPFSPDGHHFERFLTVKEINAVLESAREFGYYNLFYTALTLGLRKDEACYLQFGDIQGDRVQLKQKTIWEKSGSGQVTKRSWAPKWFRQRGGRWVYLDKNYAKDGYLQKILKDGHGDAYCNPDPAHKDGRPLNGDKIYWFFKKIVREARVQNAHGRKEQIHNWREINVHTLRHTHISYAVARVGKDPNLSLPIIMENVGINDYQTIRRYAQAVKDLAENLPDPTRFPWQKD